MGDVLQNPEKRLLFQTLNRLVDVTKRHGLVLF